MADRTITLVKRLQVANVWTQLDELAGSAYSVPALMTADARWLKAINKGGALATVEFALSSGSVISNAEVLCPPIPLTENETLLDSDGFALPTGYGVWARTSGSDVVIRGYLLENS